MPGQLRAGDTVRVRSAADILATLDDHGRLSGMPFMPEMLRYAGQEMRIYKRADKTCDTVAPAGGVQLQLENTVHLMGARCDGSAHGGCQAACLLFFREDWLESSQRPAAAPGTACTTSPTGAACTTDVDADVLYADTTQGVTDKGAPLYRCQATELPNAATGTLTSRDWSQYPADVRTRNERPHIVLIGLFFLFLNYYQRASRRLPSVLRIKGGAEFPLLRGTGTGERTPETLDLQPGDLVEVRSKEEIEATLDADNKNRGMRFDVEQLRFCGRQARVLKRVDKIIEESSGRMIKLRDCIILEDVYCHSLYHRFCQRAIYHYWREAWLRKIDE